MIKLKPTNSFKKFMKKVLLFASLLFICNSKAHAQTEGLKQFVNFGGVFAASGTMPFSSGFKAPTLGYNFSPDVCFLTRNTYTNFLYTTANNGLKLINAYKNSNEIGIYLALSKSLSTESKYAGVGMEKFIHAGSVTFFLYAEIGNNFSPNLSVFTFGMHCNVQTLIWKSK